MPLILPGNVASATASTTYDVANSCMFDGSSAYLRKTFSGTSTDSNKCTMSFWCKKATNGANLTLLTANIGGSSNRDRLYFDADDKLQFFLDNAGDGNLLTNRVFRDNSAWYHIFIAIDTTQGTAANRVKIYINGTQETSFGTESYPAEDYALTGFGHSVEHTIGADDSDGGSNEYYNGYMAEVAFVNGVAHAVTDFGEFNEDSPQIWQPKDITSGITWGTNGFYLDFEDSDNLGDDESGNTHDFAETNIAATDQGLDSPTNNFCTLNPLTNHSNGITLSEGNLKCTTSDSPWQGQSATFGVSAGKWYYEVLATETSVDQYIVAGIQSDYLASSQAGTFGFLYNYSYGMKFYDGDKVYNESDGGTSADHGNAVTDGQIVGVAFDLDNQKMYFSINGTWQNSGDPTSGATGTGSITNLQSGQTYIPNITLGNSGGDPIASVNFGSPSFAISSGNSDADGYGNFEYSVPSGYYSLCTKNLGAYGG